MGYLVDSNHDEPTKTIVTKMSIFSITGIGEKDRKIKSIT